MRAKRSQSPIRNVLIVIGILPMVAVGSVPTPAVSVVPLNQPGCHYQRDRSCCACGEDSDGYYCHPGARYGILGCRERPWPVPEWNCEGSVCIGPLLAE